MGKIITAPIDMLRPTQVTLIEHDFRCLLRTFDEGLLKSCLPLLASQLGDGSYAVFDGTHRTVLNDIVGNTTLSVYLPNNEYDILLPENFPENSVESVAEANENLQGYTPRATRLKFQQTIEKGINTFGDLKREYGLHTLEDLRRFSRGEIAHRWAKNVRFREGYY